MLSSTTSRTYIQLLNITFWVIFLTLFSFEVKAHDCSDSSLQMAYERIYKNIDAFGPVLALKTADSVLQLIDKDKIKACELAFWIRYEIWFT